MTGCVAFPEPTGQSWWLASVPSLGQSLGCSQAVEPHTPVLPLLPHVFVNTLASFGPEEVFKCVIYFSNYDNCYKIKI